MPLSIIPLLLSACDGNEEDPYLAPLQNAGDRNDDIDKAYHDTYSATVGKNDASIIHQERPLTLSQRLADVLFSKAYADEPSDALLFRLRMRNLKSVLSTGVELVDWALAMQEAIEKKEPIPQLKADTLGGIIKQLKQYREAIQNQSIPELKPDLSAWNDLFNNYDSTQSRMKRRIAVHQVVSAMQKTITYEKEILLLKQDYQKVRDYYRKVYPIIESLQNDLQYFAGFPGMQATIAKLILVDLEQAKSAIAGVTGACHEKQKLCDIRFNDSGTLYKQYQDIAKEALQKEKDDLSRKRESLIVEAQALEKEYNDMVDVWNGKVVTAKLLGGQLAEDQKEARRILSAVADLENDADRVYAGGSQAESLDAQIKRLQEQQRQAYPYNLCPNGRPYDTCDHEELKQEWNNRIRTLDSDIRELKRERDEWARTTSLGADEVSRRADELGIRADLVNGRMESEIAKLTRIKEESERMELQLDRLKKRKEEIPQEVGAIDTLREANYSDRAWVNSNLRE